MSTIEESEVPKFRRRCSEINLKRSCSGSQIDLDDLMFKSPSLNMTPKRKRKRHRTDDDNLSLASVDVNTEEPKKRRRSSLARMTSLASLTNLLSPVKPVKKFGQALQKSLSLKNLMTPSPNKYIINAYRAPAPTPPKRRLSTMWHETLHDTGTQLTKQQIERQEAIFELYKNEEDLIEDLNMVKTTYHDSMAKLRLLTENELSKIFGSIETLVPLHRDLVDGLREQRQHDGTTETIGQVLLDWVPRLSVYSKYCAGQVEAKALLDLKKQDPAVEDFLERCQESPFSRKLDLWNFLDVPRSRLVKYPLLFKAIQKRTPHDHPDIDLIAQAVELVDGIISDVDKKTGEAKCRFIHTKLDYLEEKQKTPLIDESSHILCDGLLKNSRGTKVHVFLFEKVLVLTRPATRQQTMRYQVYRQPIPIMDLRLSEDGSTGKMGSFRSAFSSSSSAKHQFRVWVRGGTKSQCHTLNCRDEHDKRQWVNSIKSLLPERPEGEEEDEFKENDSLSRQNSTGSMMSLRRTTSGASIMSLRRQGSSSSMLSLRRQDSGMSMDSRYSVDSRASCASTVTNAGDLAK